MNAKLEYIRTKKFEDLTTYDIHDLRYAGILNGFGGASQSWLVRWLIGWILADFDKAIPDKHDFGYWIGVRYYRYHEKIYSYKTKRVREFLKRMGEQRRLECDEKFYQAMLDDIRARYDDGMIGKWGLTWKSFVALGAYSAIRWKGSKFFNYS